MKTRRRVAMSGDVAGTASGSVRAAGEPAPAHSSAPVEVDLSVELAAGLRLANPILVAAGVFGYGVELADLVDIARLGAICTRSTTLRARTGSPSPRMVAAPAALLASIGFQNPGVEAVVERHAPAWRGWQVPVIVSIAGESASDIAEVARRLDGVAGVSGIELNLASPNGARGLPFAAEPLAAGSLTGVVRRASTLPLIVKLSPHGADVRAVARAVADAGADAICAINPPLGLAVRPDRTGPLLGGVHGGLSGPAIRPIALRVVYEVAGAVSIPIVGCGGIVDLDDVLDFLAVGASAVQVGSALLAEPGLAARLVDGLLGECRRRGLASVGSLVGSALPVPRARMPRPARP